MQKATTKTLGGIVKDRRKSLGLSQEQLGDLAGCGRLFVSQFENGKPGVRFDKVLDVLRVLGLELHVRNGSAGLVIDGDA